MKTTTQPGAGEQLPTGEVLVGDALGRLRELPSGSIDCVVTSPPYFLLRNYGVAGQLGHEAWRVQVVTATP